MTAEYIRVSLADLQTPKDGYICMMDRWWVVEDGHALGYKLFANDRPSPQCNHDKRVVEHVLQRRPEVQKVQFVPVAYWYPSRG